MVFIVLLAKRDSLFAILCHAMVELNSKRRGAITSRPNNAEISFRDIDQSKYEHGGSYTGELHSNL